MSGLKNNHFKKELLSRPPFTPLFRVDARAIPKNGFLQKWLFLNPAQNTPEIIANFEKGVRGGRWPKQ